MREEILEPASLSDSAMGPYILARLLAGMPPPAGEIPVVQMGKRGKPYLYRRDLRDFIRRQKRRLP